MGGEGGDGSRHPDDAVPAVKRTVRAPRRWRRRRRLPPRRSAPQWAVLAEVAFGQPDAADVHAPGGHDAVGVPQHELRAAAAEVHHQDGVLAAGRQDAAGAGEGQCGFLVAGDHFGFDAEEAPGSPSMNICAVPGIPAWRRLRRSGLCRHRARGSVPHTPASPGRCGPGPRARTRRWRQRPGPAAPHAFHAPRRSAPCPVGPCSMSAMSRRMELVPQSMAATRVMAGLRFRVSASLESAAWGSCVLADRGRPAPMAGQALGPVAAEVLDGGLAAGVPGAVAVALVRGPPFADGCDGLVAERVDAGAGRQRVAHEDVQAFHAGGHATGGDTVDFGNRADAGPCADLGPRTPGRPRGPPGRRPPASRLRRAGRSSRSSGRRPRAGRPRR